MLCVPFVLFYLFIIIFLRCFYSFKRGVIDRRKKFEDRYMNPPYPVVNDFNQLSMERFQSKLFSRRQIKHITCVYYSIGVYI